MGKPFKLPINVIDDKDQISVSISVTDDLIAEWCLGLCLLERDLLESLTIVSNTGSFKLKILKDPSLPQSGRGIVKWRSAGAELQISQTELEMWLDYFLKYCRDGVADVNHIDVDIPSQRDAKGLFATFEVANALPPVSREEAMRRLGL